MECGCKEPCNPCKCQPAKEGGERMNKDIEFLIRYTGCLQRGDTEGAEKVRLQAAAEGFSLMSPEPKA